MEKLKFIWIDDQPKREAVARTLESSLNVKLNFVNVNGGAVDEALAKLTNGDEPDLIILDHSLDLAISQTYRTGSTAASYLHEKWPKCPIVSCTGIDIVGVDIRHKSAYEAMYPDNHISDYYETINSIAMGFKSLRESVFTDPENLVRTLSCPESDVEKITKILPRELKENLDDSSIISEWYRWCNSILFDRPGFLYNQQWAALLLGLTDKGFESVQERFKMAKYAGVFSTDSYPRWWKSQLISLLSEHTGIVGLPWEIGRNLVTSKELYSTCSYSGEEFPETIAALDATNPGTWEPMKLKYTYSHPNFEDMLFFEELRIMSSED